MVNPVIVCVQEGVRLPGGAELHNQLCGAPGDLAAGVLQLSQDGEGHLLRGRAQASHREGARDPGRPLRNQGK